jgi:uncharacterized protein YkwD
MSPFEVDALVNVFSFQKMGFNFLDFVIFLIFLFYTIEGFEIGFLLASFDLASFILAFVLALKSYAFFGGFLNDLFKIPPGMADVIAFFLVAFFTEITLNFLLRKIYLKIKSAFDSEEKKRLSKAWGFSANRFLGIFPGMLSAFILVSFILTVIVTLPFSAFLRKTIYTSKLGSFFITNAQGFEKNVNALFGGALNETLSFLTVEPEGNESVNLKFKTTKISVDKEVEKEMLNLMNQERQKAGQQPLVFDEKLTQVARSHAKDMLEKGYFSHNTMDGLSPFDRLAIANINYTSAGENLAFSPNVILAMNGLMNSPGHKANILSPNYGKVGIGVMDAGVFGQMFVQEFSN